MMRWEKARSYVESARSGGMKARSNRVKLDLDYKAVNPVVQHSEAIDPAAQHGRAAKQRSKVARVQLFN
ncbi:hypothetical protein E2562_013544 [Oryza meyeriana var. granulata]|uniref:Uncharacterized protein n=1 Tax=Oryza meyeriana var. granulata TaxID=110450 RepID=A0A6G1D4C0_9ORYZ|nr:hypothetical protein E2562_013544 [Oryza meyeriana var. granulata]